MHSLTVLGLALVLRQVSHHTVFVGAAGAADSGKELEALSASGTPLPLHDEFSRHLLREPGPLLDTDSEVIHQPSGLHIPLHGFWEDWLRTMIAFVGKRS